MNEVRFSVPLTPPSVNDYVRHTRAGRHYVGKEGKAYKTAVAIFARGQSLCAGKSKYELTRLRYDLEVTVFMAKGERGDGDNFFKCIADGLKECQAIHSDAAISDWHLHVRRDPEHPRTEITVRTL